MTAERQIHNIALIGFMGTGKSSVGRLVAEQLRYPFLDTDEMIQARAGKSVAAIFADEGESRFREYEKEIVAELAARTQTVICTGGGLGANEANTASLKQHALVVCLWASPEKIWERVGGQTHRPLLQGPDPMSTIRRLLAERDHAYKQADILLATDARSLKEVAAQVIHQFRHECARQT